MASIFKSAIKVMILAVIVLGTVACGDHYIINLTIFPDGSFEKTLEWSTNSDNPQTDNFIFSLHTDSSWIITKKGKTMKKTMFGNSREVWTFQASKKFTSVQELNQEYISNQKSHISPRVEFKKHFKGIFTIFSFRETYPILHLFKKFPASSHFTPEEMKHIHAILEDIDESEKQIPENIRKEIEKKTEKWMRLSLFEEFFSLLLQEAEKLNDNARIKQMLLEQKDKMLSHFSKLNKDEIFKINIKRFLTEYGEIEANPLYSLLWEKGKSAFIIFENEVAAIDDAILDNYTNHITMPGIITSTNAPSMTGNTASWEVPFLMLLFRDMVMEVESRQINWWFIGLGAPLLILILIGLVSAIRQKKLK